MQRGDINHISLDLLGPALNSDYFIVFSGSYLRGPLLEFLVKKQAINIHAGISPYFRGMACNFWACQYRRPDLVGSTIHLLSKGLDSGPILFHALPRVAPIDPFLLGMEAIAAARDGIVHYLSKNMLKNLEPLQQNRGEEILYSRGEDFTDQIAREYMNRLMTARDIGGLLAERDANQFVRPFVQK